MSATIRPGEERNYFDLGLKHKYLYFRRTKIIATIGPACQDTDTLEKLLTAGMDVARLNFSHGSHADHADVIAGQGTAALELLEEVPDLDAVIAPVGGGGHGGEVVPPIGRRGVHM